MSVVEEKKIEFHPEEYFTGFNTKAIHVGNEPDPATYAVSVPIYMTSNFVIVNDNQKYHYSRAQNPTRSALQADLASLEKAKYCVCCASGISACGLVMHLFKPGEHILCCEDINPAFRNLMQDITKSAEGVIVDFADIVNVSSVKNNLRKETKAVWLESPSHSKLRANDIKGIAKVCKENNLIFIVDNTTLSPYLCNPLELGASIVIHWCSNLICGHGDVMMGAVMTNDETLYTNINRYCILLGCIASPFDSYLVLRGVKTLGVRLDEALKNTIEIAKLLENHPKLEKIIYPGLEKDVSNEILEKQAKGYGTQITIFIKGGLANAEKFLNKLAVIQKSIGLGGVISTGHIPIKTTYKNLDAEIVKKMGITENMVKLSIGIEDFEDLKKDILNALNGI